ncbi:hypothetical protein PILCRDRAFT_92222 [Piloderma croceum F 1598]|uniref:Uncharacterized protein n=1 Tax=Piloderma croceum (strain F 1598) TaxID=765440 RepID=A0A0C3BD96_PILCF|nr:hypothetical protein PILCRDRAFT_92222 [Piloderma croceum F 1598]
MDRWICLMVLPVFFGHLMGSTASLRVWLAVQRTPITAKSDVETTSSSDETTPSSDGGSETGLITGGIVAGSLILLILGLGIGHIVSWELLFNFILGSALMLPLTEMMFSCLYDLFGIRQTLYRNLDGELKLDPGYTDDGPRTPWQKVASASRFVVGVGLPTVTLYGSSDIGASFLLFAIIYAFQAHHNRTVVFMQDVICTAVEMYVDVVLLFTGTVEKKKNR